ncbi:MAG: hypothetical protein IH899_21510, partial [Planctomycetes bacterium]|nr:hypothetical protein [Planctomycetota bacterium]
MERYLDATDLTIEASSSIDTSQFGEIEVLGSLAQMKDANKPQNFYFGEGGSVLSSSVIHDGILYFGACDRQVYALT